MENYFTRSQAFPTPDIPYVHSDGSPDYQEGSLGMEMIDYFAAKAMQALVRNTGRDNFVNAPGIAQLLARSAYDIAEAMCDEATRRAQKEGGNEQ